MKNIIFKAFFAVFAAVLLSSCSSTDGPKHIPVPGFGNIVWGGEGESPYQGIPNEQQHFEQEQGQYAGNGHSGPPGQRGRRPEPRLIDGGGEFNKSTHQNGQHHDNVKFHATISARFGALTMEQRPPLCRKLEDWAFDAYKASDYKTIPTSADATKKLVSMLGHDNARVNLTSNITEKIFVAEERRLVSREKINPDEIPSESVALMQKKAIEQFKRNGSNEMVTEGRYHKN